MYKIVLLTVDLNDESSWEKALPTAVEYCKAFGSVLHVLTVVPDFGMAVVAQFFPENYRERALAQAEEDLGAFVGAHVPSDVRSAPIVGYGTVYEEIMRTAREIDADLIVMAAHRPELKDYLIGPNAARVVRHSARSVLVVRG